MSSPIISFYTFKFSIIVTIIITTSKFVTSENVMINKICDLTDFPEFCKRALNSHPQSPGADVDMLTWISINLVTQKANGITNEITEMKENNDDQIELQKLNACNLKLRKVLTNMQTAITHYQEGNYDGIRDIARESVTEVEGCNYENSSGEFPLDGNILNLKLLLKIVVTIGDNPYP